MIQLHPAGDEIASEFAIAAVRHEADAVHGNYFIPERTFESTKRRNQASDGSLEATIEND
ncbi:hypothetical protein QQZ08_008465 [Neonectria magnoliae]|uniref:Uncharacterized protein n=1 Tax=Neonectria magnoliae TaxID=2732573 RepID=A0ABR1HVB6_9HYPO